jgi:hypothetical protein
MRREIRMHWPWIGHAVILVLLLASAGATRAALVAPRERERKVLDADRIRLETQLEDYQRGVREMEAWSREHPGEDAMGSAGRHAPPARVMVSRFLKALVPIADRHRIVTRSIQPAGRPVLETAVDPAGGPVAYQKVELRFQLEAGYRELGEYLRDIERMDQLAVVRSVSLRYDAAAYPNLAAGVTVWLYGTP